MCQHHASAARLSLFAIQRSGRLVRSLNDTILTMEQGSLSQLLLLLSCIAPALA